MAGFELGRGGSSGIVDGDSGDGSSDSGNDTPFLEMKVTAATADSEAMTASVAAKAAGAGGTKNGRDAV